MKSLLITLLLAVNLSSIAQQIDIQGHRGARGLLPENTIPSFIRALEEGVTTLELDVVITKDNEVLVSHDHYMSADICSKPNGIAIEKKEADEFNIYEMTYEETQKFDCGIRGHKGFPEQKQIKVSKPLLKDVIEEVERYLKVNNLPAVSYNIEIKSGEGGDFKNHPPVDEFSKLVLEVAMEYLDLERFNIQSFDFRVLKYIHENYPQVTLAVLIGSGSDVKGHLKKLGFIPQIYSPHYSLITRDDVSFCHEKGMKVIPWTINDLKAMRATVDKGVDGIITDYPDRAKNLRK